MHSEYERLRDAVLDYVSLRRRDPGLLHAIDKNLSHALLRGDFLMSETKCRENLEEASLISERNYWVSVLYIILARMGRL